MRHFIVELTYTVPFEQLADVIPLHRSFLQAGYERGDVLCSGPQLPKTGGIIVLDDSACMVDMARYLVGFFLDESCGKCVPCREGLRQLSGIMDRICGGSGSEADLVLLERLAGTMKSAAVCGLGGMAPGAVLATLQNFREEFKTHIHDKSCPAGVCRDLKQTGSAAGRMEA